MCVAGILTMQTGGIRDVYHCPDIDYNMINIDPVINMLHAGYYLKDYLYCFTRSVVCNESYLGNVLKVTVSCKHYSSLSF